MTAQITVKPWAEMSADEFFEIAQLRSEVFFLEQRINVPDFDAVDRCLESRHWWISDERGCAAYARSLLHSTAEHSARRSFGRLAVRRDRRGEGLGRALVSAMVERYGQEPMVIHAQSYAARLYAEFGFEPVGEEFLEAGITHRVMLRKGRIRVSAVALSDVEGRVLLVRKRGTGAWFNPGGKPEPGESPQECAAREVWEELGLFLDPAELIPVGRREAPAANEPGVVVVADIFKAPRPLEQLPQPRAEIAEVCFVDPSRPQANWSPLFTDELRHLL